MPFVCPSCLLTTLDIVHKIELPPDSRSDEIALQVVECTNCDFAGAAVYEESRRGASELWDHTGYRCDKSSLQKLRHLIRTCPRPKDRKCRCAAHNTLAEQSASGRWVAPDGFIEPFPLRIG